MLDGLKHEKVKKNFDVGFLSTANFRGSPESAQDPTCPKCGTLAGAKAGLGVEAGPWRKIDFWRVFGSWEG